MGAAAKTALATAVVPYGLDAKVEADLHHMMAGAVEALSEAGLQACGRPHVRGHRDVIGCVPCPQVLQLVLRRAMYMGVSDYSTVMSRLHRVHPSWKGWYTSCP